MKLDEAIERYTSNAEYERTHGNLQGFLEFNQLAKWLRDYKRLLEREAVLDKIRAEIEELDGRYVIGDYGIYGENIPKYVRFGEVLAIIDKYKESEVRNDSNNTL